MQMLDANALNMTILHLSSHLLGAFLFLLGKFCKCLLFLLSLLLSLHFRGRVVDLTDGADAQTDAVWMQFFKKTVYKAFLALFRGLERVCLESIKIRLTAAWDYY